MLLNRIFKFSWLIFSLSACASPQYMEYQRSEYGLNKFGDIVASTSPDFGQSDFRRISGQPGTASVEIMSRFIVQNTGTEAHEFDFTLAKAEIRGQHHQLQCVDAKGNKEKSILAATEKNTISCSLILLENQSPKADSWVVFSLPTNKGAVILSKKLIRLEDFEQ